MNRAGSGPWTLGTISILMLGKGWCQGRGPDCQINSGMLNVQIMLKSELLVAQISASSVFECQGLQIFGTKALKSENGTFLMDFERFMSKN